MAQYLCQTLHAQEKVVSVGMTCATPSTLPPPSGRLVQELAGVATRQAAAKDLSVMASRVQGHHACISRPLERLMDALPRMATVSARICRRH